MGKTFLDIRGERHRADNYTGVSVDEDIVSNEVTNYYVCLHGEPIIEVTEEVYQALKSYFKETRF